MNNKLYVGNLPFTVTEPDLQDLFSQAGAVTEVMLVQDKFTAQSRGFGFVTMSSEAEAEAAIQKFHGKEFEGRALTVNIARPREERTGGGGGGRSSGGYGGGGGGGRSSGGGDRRGGSGGGGGGRGGRY